MKSIRKGYRKKRVPRPKEKNPIKGYDSNWEYELHTGILDNWSFHTDKVPYVVEHKYEPDFIKEIEGKKILIAKVLPADTELVFLFANPSAPMPQAKRRKDGTKRSHGEWASANDFRWYSEESIPDSWINAKKRETF